MTRCCFTVEPQLLDDFDRFCLDLGKSRSHMLRLAMKALQNGAIVYADLKSSRKVSED
jgi:hypothetical protein